MSLVTKSAIDFTAPAVMSDGEISDNFNFYQHVKNKYALLFFYPLDFTFVCPTEIISLSDRVNEFAKLNTEVIGISVDSKFSHWWWRNIKINKGGIGKINFPLVSDITKEITTQYDVLLDNAVALRSAFIIDSNFKIRHQVTNDLPIGRNIDEFLRIIEAIQHFEKHGEVCPAGWKKGDAAMEATQQGVADFFTSHIDNFKKNNDE